MVNNSTYVDKNEQLQLTLKRAIASHLNSLNTHTDLGKAQNMTGDNSWDQDTIREKVTFYFGDP
jgi:hypothetical protein